MAFRERVGEWACQHVAESIRRCWTVDRRTQELKRFHKNLCYVINIVLSEMTEKITRDKKDRE
jgi:hypothetical protein